MQRVWDYVNDSYVHRLIQSKTDGKLVEVGAQLKSLQRLTALGPVIGASLPPLVLKGALHCVCRWLAYISMTGDSQLPVRILTS